MIALTIAIVALAGAGYAVFVVRRTEAGVLELIEAQAGDEDDLEVEPETTELWLDDGAFYSADKDELAKAVPNAVGFCTYEGVPCAAVPGMGVVSLHKLLSEPSKPRAVK